MGQHRHRFRSDAKRASSIESSRFATFHSVCTALLGNGTENSTSRRNDMKYRSIFLFLFVSVSIVLFLLLLRERFVAPRSLHATCMHGRREHVSERAHLFPARATCTRTFVAVAQLTLCLPVDRYSRAKYTSR